MLSRRGFLTGSSAVAAAALLPGLPAPQPSIWPVAETMPVMPEFAILSPPSVDHLMDAIRYSIDANLRAVACWWEEDLMLNGSSDDREASIL
jgi:hypothetical protein